MSDAPPMLSPLLWKALLWFDDGLQVKLRERGIMTTTRTQSQVIGCLSLGETRPSRLARAVRISPQAMPYVLNGLIKAGLVEMAQDSNDGRARVVRLTAPGKAYLETIRSIASEMEAVLENQFGKPVISVLRMILNTPWADYETQARDPDDPIDE